MSDEVMNQCELEITIETFKNLQILLWNPAFVARDPGKAPALVRPGNYDGVALR